MKSNKILLALFLLVCTTMSGCIYFEALRWYPMPPPVKPCKNPVHKPLYIDPVNFKKGGFDYGDITEKESWKLGLPASLRMYHIDSNTTVYNYYKYRASGVEKDLLDTLWYIYDDRFPELLHLKICTVKRLYNKSDSVVITNAKQEDIVYKGPATTMVFQGIQETDYHADTMFVIETVEPLIMYRFPIKDSVRRETRELYFNSKYGVIGVLSMYSSQNFISDIFKIYPFECEYDTIVKREYNLLLDKLNSQKIDFIMKHQLLLEIEPRW